MNGLQLLVWCSGVALVWAGWHLEGRATGARHSVTQSDTTPAQPEHGE